MYSNLLLVLTLIALPALVVVAATNAGDVRLKSMSSAEVKRIEAAAEKVRDDNGFDSPRRRKPKKHSKQSKTSTVAPLEETSTTAEDASPVPIDTAEEKVTQFKYVGTFAPEVNIFGIPVESHENTDVENLLNVRELKFQSLPDSKPTRGIRSADHDYVGAFLIAANADDETASADAPEETAPPELGEVVQELKSDDDILKQLQASKLLSDTNANNQGGNVPIVDFEDALKVTVPYNSEKAN